MDTVAVVRRLSLLFLAVYYTDRVSLSYVEGTLFLQGHALSSFDTRALLHSLRARPIRARRTVFARVISNMRAFFRFAIGASLAFVLNAARPSLAWECPQERLLAATVSYRLQYRLFVVVRVSLQYLLSL